MQRLATLSGFGSRAEEALILSFSALSPEQVFQFTLSVLQKPIQTRDLLDEKFLMKSFSSMPFFQKVAEEHGIEIIKTCCKNFIYEKYAPNSCISRDSRMPKLYVLIKGNVNVSINDKNSELIDKPATQELNIGMAFGDIPLISDLPKFDSVICQEECHFAVLTRESSDKIMADLTRKKLEEKTEELMTFSIFKGISKKSLFPLIHHFTLEEAPLNKVFYKEGEAPNNIYFVLSGKYKTITTVNIPLIDDFENNLTLSPRFTKKSTGRTAEVGISGQGEIIGLEDVITEKPRKTTVVCVKPGTVYRISAQDFRKRILGALHEPFIKDIQNYVKNRETWFELRRTRVTEQIVKHKEFFVSIPSQNKEDIKKRTNSLETEKDLTPEIKMMAARIRTKSVYQSQTLESPVKETPSNGVYLTSLIESDIKAFNTPLSPVVREKGINTSENSPKDFDISKKIATRFDSIKNETLEDRLDTNMSERTKVLDNHALASEVKQGPRKLTPKKYFAWDKMEEFQEETKQLFQRGIFEKNCELNPGERFGLRKKKLTERLPEIKDSDFSPSRLKKITTKLVKEKQRTIPNAKSYFAEKEKLLVKLEKTSAQTWDLQSHLVKHMQENNDLSRRIQIMKQTNVNARKTKTSTIINGDRRKANESMEIPSAYQAKSLESPCVVFHLPKRYASISENNGMKVVSKSFMHSPGSTVFEIKDRSPAKLIENVTKFQEKVKGWKGPFAILSKRLKKKFVKSQLENLNASFEYS